MGLGAIDAVRGSKSMASELLHILSHSDSRVLIVETEEVLRKLEPLLLHDAETRQKIKFAVVLWSDDEDAGNTPSGPQAVVSSSESTNSDVSATSTLREQAALCFTPPATGTSAQMDSVVSKWFPVYSYRAVVEIGQQTKKSTGTRTLSGLFEADVIWCYAVFTPHDCGIFGHFYKHGTLHCRLVDPPGPAR